MGMKWDYNKPKVNKNVTTTTPNPAACGLIYYDTKDILYTSKMFFYGIILLIFAFLVITCVKANERLCESAPYHITCGQKNEKIWLKEKGNRLVRVNS